jgi:GDPmannose 4,6-dehydratase
LKGGKISLGNIETRRDFGFAGDYVEAMADMMQQPVPGDFVIGTGETHSIAEFCEAAFGVVGLAWQEHVVSRPDLMRSADQNSCADPSKILTEVGWKAKTGLTELAKMMVQARMDLIQRCVA